MIQNSQIPVELKQLITSNQAYFYRIIPLKLEDQLLYLKTDSDNIAQLKRELDIVLDRKVKLIPESKSTIETFLSSNYRKQNTDQERLKFEDNFLQKLLQNAKDFDSSDIHIEPYEHYSRVRFRLDGKLKEQYTIDKKEYPQLINQIKIKAGLDISQKRLSQDGRITFKNQKEDIDIRVSSMPTLYGEKIVLRLLNKNTDNIRLEQLGFAESELNVYLDGIKKTQGIVLISGPTGSGKTTTLYATLKRLNKETVNVLTIEDPIEYTLEGVNQVQLREDIGFDFSAALRTFLRQDPNIIMVGEIRDEKTANMAIKAALTGHLVLSTIHTNSSWATISRLIDMKIPSFLISSTLILSIAQRLVRKLCDDCKIPDEVNVSEFPMNFKVPKDFRIVYKPGGCQTCYHTGYTGRIAIYEVLPVNSDLEKSIRNNEHSIEKYLKENNISTLQDNAFKLLKEGKTSLDEVYALLSKH